MENKFNYVSVDTIFSKINRDLRGVDVTEADIIEWTGEALGFLRVAGINEEAVAFLEVRNNKADLPDGLKVILQIAKNNSWNGESLDEFCPANVAIALSETAPVVDPEPQPQEGVLLNDLGLPDDTEVAYYRPYFDLKYEYQGWCNSTYYKENYTPVRLANNTFFNTLVAKELTQDKELLYSSAVDEYTIIGGYPNNALLFSFSEGYVAISYIRAMVDPSTGYPLIPDDISFITAVTYYIKWKLAERNRWSGVEGANKEVEDAQKNWNHYIRQAINKAKMPSTIDEYQNIMEQSLHLIPRTRNYYGFFGKLGREEERRFNNPDGRRRFTYNRQNYGFR